MRPRIRLTFAHSQPPDFPRAAEARIKHASIVALIRLRSEVAVMLHANAAQLRALRSDATVTDPVTNDLRAAARDAARSELATSLYRVVLMQQTAKAARQLASHISRVVGWRVPAARLSPEAFTIAAWAKAEEELDGFVDCAMAKFEEWLLSGDADDGIDARLQDCEDKHARQWWTWLTLMLSWLFGRMTTETHEAAGVVEAMWIDREDDRVRPAHHALHGFVFRYDEEPPLKASLASNGEACWPGDDYNCRCTARIVSAVRPAEVREETAGGGVDAA